MLSKVNSIGLFGLSGYIVSAECDLSRGLPAFDIVGLPDASVKESRNRVRAAAANCGFGFPVSKITVNLAPADTRKEGALYDLPVLLGILLASEQLKANLSDCAFIGELSLDGSLRKINGALPMAVAARESGIKRLFLPEENALEASLAEGVQVFGVSHINQLINHLSGVRALLPAKKRELVSSRESTLDFSDVKGQHFAKRALEIAAAGGHNVLLTGSPGSGKSMLAHRVLTILPDMSYEQALEATQIHSISGNLKTDTPLITERPFRAPHHTVSVASLTGGGAIPKPGEISLAHHGVLFLDEFPEFSRASLEALRQPLENGEVTIARVAGTLTYPAEFMLVCAMNPCKCGWYGHPTKKCTCTQSMVDSYIGRVSGPLMDRIDMHIGVESVTYDDMSKKSGTEEKSASIRSRVSAARERQTARGISCNARMTAANLDKYCELDAESRSLMRSAFDKFGMTGRSHDKTLRIARTIADLAGSEKIEFRHLAEALQYRSMNNA